MIGKMGMVPHEWVKAILVPVYSIKPRVVRSYVRTPEELVCRNIPKEVYGRMVA